MIGALFSDLIQQVDASRSAQPESFDSLQPGSTVRSCVSCRGSYSISTICKGLFPLKPRRPAPQQASDCEAGALEA